MAKEKEARRPFNLKREVKLLPGYIILLLWVIFTIALLGWVFGASFSTTAEIFQGKALKFESGLHFENYAKAWNGAGVAGFFGNSLIYSVISCTILILVCAPAAYVLSRFDFIANKFIQTSFVSAMGVPAIMVVLPLFSIISGMGILNNVAAGRTVLIILYVGINVPYTTIFLLTFFSNISRTYEEAAAIDGCPPMRTFWKIMFPMAQSGIVTVTIFNFINIWNEYFLSLIFASSDKLKPVAPGLYGMINSMKYTGDWAGMFSAVVIVFLPHCHRTYLVGISEYQGDEILVPYIDEVEYGYGHDSRLGHGKHNQPEGLNRGAAVNGSCFLKRPGQIGKKGGQENGGVGHIDSDIQEYQSGPVGRNIIKDIETCHHGKQRKHNHDYRNTHGRHKR